VSKRSALRLMKARRYREVRRVSEVLTKERHTAKMTLVQRP